MTSLGIEFKSRQSKKNEINQQSDVNCGMN